VPCERDSTLSASAAYEHVFELTVMLVAQCTFGGHNMSEATLAPRPGVLWPLESHTEAKHRLYKRYLDAWWPILLQTPSIRRVTYVDAFAGPGEYEGGEDGSPTFVLDRLLNHISRDLMVLTRERVTLIFIEGKKSRYDHLCKLLTARFGPLNDLPVTVIVKHGRAEQDTLPLLQSTGAWGWPILAIFDSWGNGVPLNHLEAIARNRSSEAIVTFGPNWFSRRESEDPEKLDAVFGGREYWQPSDASALPAERRRVWLATYRDAMLRAGFKYSLPFQVVPATGLPLDLVFGTGHPSGVAEFKAAMWKVDTSDGTRYSDPRTSIAKQAAFTAGQPSLFDGDPNAPDAELLQFVADSLQTGPAPLSHVREFLLRETSRWQEKDAPPAVQYLINEGRIKRDPPAGRLTRTTMLRWVG